MTVFAIDPGNVESGWCLIEKETFKPLAFAKEVNEKVLLRCASMPFDLACVEMIASYGMAVGKEVFETCKWIGRFEEKIKQATDRYPTLIYRRDEKLHICGDIRAKDSNIRQALIDRFATHDFKNGKGTKKDPDFFYGFKSDIWQSFSVAVTFVETCLK